MFQQPRKRETPHEAEEDLNRGTQAQHDTFQKKKGGTCSSCGNLGNADLKGNVSERDTERVIAAFSFCSTLCWIFSPRPFKWAGETRSSCEPQPSIVESADDNDVSHRQSSLRRPRPRVFSFFSPPTSDWQAKCCSSDGGYEEKCKIISTAARVAHVQSSLFLTSGVKNFARHGYKMEDVFFPDQSMTSWNWLLHDFLYIKIYQLSVLLISCNIWLSCPNINRLTAFPWTLRAGLWSGFLFLFFFLGI